MFVLWEFLSVAWGCLGIALGLPFVHLGLLGDCNLNQSGKTLSDPRGLILYQTSDLLPLTYEPFPWPDSISITHIRPSVHLAKQIPLHFR